MVFLTNILIPTELVVDFLDPVKSFGLGFLEKSNLYFILSSYWYTQLSSLVCVLCNF